MQAHLSERFPVMRREIDNGDARVQSRNPPTEFNSMHPWHTHIGCDKLYVTSGFLKNVKRDGRIYRWGHAMPLLSKELTKTL